MEARGIRRKVDDLGRVVIPSTIRKALGIGEGDEVEFGVDRGRVVMARVEDRCVFCGEGDHVATFMGRVVCWSCAAALRAMDRERAGERPASPF